MTLKKIELFRLNLFFETKGKTPVFFVHILYSQGDLQSFFLALERLRQIIEGR